VRLPLASVSQLGRRADQPAVVVIAKARLLAQRVGRLRDAALRIEGVRGGVGDVRARAVDLGEVAHPVVGEGGGVRSLARSRPS